MKVEHVEVMVEEPSAEALLSVLLPKLVGHASFAIHVHQGKKDLLDKLPKKLKAYRHWLPDSHRILVLVDRDNADCLELKKQLDRMALDAELPPPVEARERKIRRRQSLSRRGARGVVLRRLGCREVGVSASGLQRHRPNQVPRTRQNCRWNLGSLRALHAGAGYFKTGLRKIEAARAVAPHMDPDRNTSSSFRALCSALLEMT